MKKNETLEFNEVIKAVFPFLKPYLFVFILGSILILLSTSVETYLPLLMGKIVEKAVPGSQDINYLKEGCLLFLVLVFGKSIIDVCQAYLIQKAGQGISHELRSEVFEKITRLKVSTFDENPTGRLLTRVINDIKSLSELFTASISVLALDILVIIGTVIAMVVLNPKIGLLVLSPFPFVIWTVLYFGQKQAESYRDVRKHLSHINAFLGENISGIPTIQRLKAEKSRAGSFGLISERHFNSQMKSLKLFALVQPFANILNGISMAVLIGVGGYYVLQGEISIGLVIAYLGYLRNLYQPIRDLVEKYNTFLSAYVSTERVVRILKEENESLRDPISTPVKAQNYSIEFKNVTFQYAKRSLKALENISFKIEEGKSLAIVGATGSGKSSIVRLLLRFYDLTDGEILLGGKDITEWNRHDLRKQIGMIHQDVYLLAGTLRENLTLGREGVDDSTLIEHCKITQVWDFVENRGGLDFHIYEGGSNLSLGEKQLINFARVLVVNPPILIFDEATSSIDRVLEEKIMEALLKVSEGRTTIAIAHRLSTIEACSKIIVLENGKLEEEGTYNSLRRKNGLFEKFYRIYSNA